MSALASPHPLRSRRLVLGVLVVLTLGACKRPEDELGRDLIDPADTLGLVVTDTTTLLAWTVREEPVKTNGLSRNALGSYVDPRFGTVRARIVTQVRLSTNNVGSGQDNTGLVIDSAVLALRFEDSGPVYGDLSAQRFTVHEITEALSLDSTYRVDDVPGTVPTDLVRPHDGLITPQPGVRPVVGTDTLGPQLRIPLDPAFGQRLLGRFGTADMVDNAAFLGYLKGLLIGVDNPGQLPGQGGILYLNLLLAESKLTLYYRNTLPGAEDTLSFDLLINDNCVRYTVMEHGHDAAVEPGLPEALADTTLGGTCYVQSLGGLRTRIALPHVLDYPERDLRALAKAELVVPVRGDWPDALEPSPTLFLFRSNDEGEDLLLPDQLTSGLSIGGELDEDDRVYRFAITRYMQRLLNGDYGNTGLSIVPGNGGVAVDRTVLRGPEDTEDPMRLILTFTTY